MVGMMYLGSKKGGGVSGGMTHITTFSLVKLIIKIKTIYKMVSQLENVSLIQLLASKEQFNLWHISITPSRSNCCS